MKKIHLSLLCLISFLSFTIMTIPKAEAANIGNGTTVTAPPQTDQAMNFTAPAPGGTFIIEPGVTFVGALTTDGGAAIGTLVLNTASVYQGAVGNPAILQITLNGDATIQGATGAQNFSLGQNTLTNTGALNLPSGLVLNTRVISDTVFGNIDATGFADSISGSSITVNVDASGVTSLTDGQPLFIIAASGTTNGLPVIVTSNNILWSFTGLNVTGNVEIFPTFHPPASLVTNPIAAGSVGAILPALTTIAAANPGSDLATVITALVTLPTVDALTDALLQIAPASGFVGISQESFNTTRQFQKVWLENLYRFREHCCMDDCCNLVERVCCDPCGKNPTDAKSSPMCRKCIDCEGPRIWATGFGSHSHQNPRDFLNGYKANTYGGTIAFDAPLVCGLRAGVGAGYAFTDLDESRFDNATDINNYEGTFYLSYTSYSWFVNTGFSFGWDQFYGTRNINYTGVSRTAHAKYNGQEYTGFFATGYQKYFNCFEFTPFATVIATYQHIGDFTETGADSLNLHINEQNYTYVESGLGLQIAYLFRTCHGVYVPEVHSIWLHDFYQNRLNVDAIFTGLGAGAGSFPNTGPGIGRNTWDIGGSITFMISRTFSIMVNYDYNRSKAYYSHQGLLELSYSF